MNVRCIKDNCEMVPHENNIFICLMCEARIQVAVELEKMTGLISGAKLYDDV